MSDLGDAETLTAIVGSRVRALRQERGLSLAALAASAGIGKGSLSEIENGARNPTLGTLYALAGALATPLATLLAERVGSEVRSPGITARLLDASRQQDGTLVETYALVLEPGHLHRSGAHGDGVVEHLLLTEGSARAGRLDDLRTVTTGESVTWVSDAEHGYQALEGRPAHAVLVIRSPHGTSTQASG